MVADGGMVADGAVGAGFVAAVGNNVGDGAGSVAVRVAMMLALALLVGAGARVGSAVGAHAVMTASVSNPAARRTVRPKADNAETRVAGYEPLGPLGVARELRIIIIGRGWSSGMALHTSPARAIAGGRVKHIT